MTAYVAVGTWSCQGVLVLPFKSISRYKTAKWHTLAHRTLRRQQHIVERSFPEDRKRWQRRYSPLPFHSLLPHEGAHGPEATTTLRVVLLELPFLLALVLRQLLSARHSLQHLPRAQLLLFKGMRR